MDLITLFWSFNPTCGMKTGQERRELGSEIQIKSCMFRRKMNKPAPPNTHTQLESHPAHTHRHKQTKFIAHCVISALVILHSTISILNYINVVHHIVKQVLKHTQTSKLNYRHNWEKSFNCLVKRQGDLLNILKVIFVSIS